MITVILLLFIFISLPFIFITDNVNEMVIHLEQPSNSMGNNAESPQTTSFGSNAPGIHTILPDICEDCYDWCPSWC